jgi:shikimate dehydrogenase
MELNVLTKTGLIGYPLGHSLSPQMHNASFKELELGFNYKAIEVKPEDLETTVERLKQENFKGFNVTIPYKIDVMQYLDKITKDAELIGAVNTVVNEAGELVGYNTDGAGFICSCKEQEIDFVNKKILVIGAGGASRAVTFSLAQEDIKELYIVDIEKHKADNLVSDISRKLEVNNVYSIDLTEEQIEKADVIINATPIGMKQEQGSPVNIDWINDKHVCIDVIYNPLKTVFLDQSAKKGCKIINGIGMLVHQGALAFKLWTGKDAPVELMRHEVLLFLNK